MMHSQHASGPSQTPFSIGGGGVILDPEKRKRNRTFIDPVSEVPRLEEWFILNTHPSHALIARYTDELNRLPYRQKVSSGFILPSLISSIKLIASCC